MGLKARAVVDDVRNGLGELRRRLFEQVLGRVEALEVEGAIYCLALAWSPGQPSSLPPLLAVGLESERREWIAEYGDDGAAQYMWSPAEFSRFDEPALDLATDKIREISGALNREYFARSSESGAWAEVSAMLNDLATTLYLAVSMSAVQTTSDFVSYACDYQLSDFANNLEQSSPPEVVERLRRSRWIA